MKKLLTIAFILLSVKLFAAPYPLLHFWQVNYIDVPTTVDLERGKSYVVGMKITLEYNNPFNRTDASIVLNIPTKPVVYLWTGTVAQCQALPKYYYAPSSDSLYYVTITIPANSALGAAKFLTTGSEALINIVENSAVGITESYINKEIEAVEYYNLLGQVQPTLNNNTLYIRKTTYLDHTIRIDKVFWNY